MACGPSPVLNLKLQGLLLEAYPYTSGPVECRRGVPIRIFLFTFILIVLGHYIVWVSWMGKYSAFSLLAGVSIPFLFCLATCYAPERRFRGCREFESYRGFVAPFTLVFMTFPAMPGVIHVVITEGLTVVTLFLLLLILFMYLYLSLWYLRVWKWCARQLI